MISTEQNSELYQCVLELTNRDTREAALFKLSNKRAEFPDLAPILWHSFGTIAALLQEIVSIYPLVSPPQLTGTVSNRCCNALALLQCVASHQETRSLFLNSHLGLFLYPFLNTRCQERQYEYLRLTSLGVIGALVKVDDPDVISFLLNTEIIPLCLSIMGTGKELSQTVATFIIQKILMDELGLNYVCATYERFDTVSQVLSKMVKDGPSTRLLKHIVRCYLRLSDNQRACDALRHKLPEQLKDNTFAHDLKEDVHTQHWLAKLLSQVNEGSGGNNNGSSNNPLPMGNSHPHGVHSAQAQITPSLQVHSVNSQLAHSQQQPSQPSQIHHGQSMQSERERGPHVNSHVNQPQHAHTHAMHVAHHGNLLQGQLHPSQHGLGGPQQLQPHLHAQIRVGHLAHVNGQQAIQNIVFIMIIFIIIIIHHFYLGASRVAHE
jgi:CCR4-NOT transcription complex subunit 9